MKKTERLSLLESIASAMITTFVAIAMPVTMLAPFTPQEITDALQDVSINWVSFLAFALLAALVAGAVVSFKQTAGRISRRGPRELFREGPIVL